MADGVDRSITCVIAGLLALKAGCGGRSEDAEPLDSPPIDAAVVDACVRLISCPSGVTHRSVSECLLVNGGPFMNPDRERIVTGVNTFSDVRSASIACIDGAAADCAAVSACATGKRGDCAGLPPGEAVCEGNRLVTCREGVRSELDCTTKDCELTFSCDAQPKAAACLVVNGGAECGFEPCSKETFREACDGDTLVVCQNGVVKHIDCSPVPSHVVTTCGERPGGGFGCIPATPACAPEARPHCEGTEVVSCIAGRETRRSCGMFPIPMVCGVEEPCGPDKSCVTCIPSPRLRCDPRKHVDRCNGTSVVYCDGQEREIDCLSLGFRECVAASGTATCR